jgi:hypothetical protein
MEKLTRGKRGGLVRVERIAPVVPRAQTLVAATPSRDGFEPDQGIEAIVAAVALPDVADFDAAAALGEFRIFRQRQQFAAARASRPPAIAFVQITHGHGDLKRHDDSSVRMGTL